MRSAQPGARSRRTARARRGTRDGAAARTAAIDPHDAPRRGAEPDEVEREAHRRTCGPRGSAGGAARGPAGQGVERRRGRARAHRSPRASWTRRPPRERRRAAARGAPASQAPGVAHPPDRSLRAQRRAGGPRLPPPPRPQARDELVDRHAAVVALAVAAHRDRARLGLAVADDEHVGDLAQLGLADLAPDGLGAVVDLGAQRRPRAARRRPRGAASTWRSAIGSTIAWTGASQSGNSPA